jgi:hypothetical protein
MKVREGVDKDSQLIHSVADTPANVYDLTPIAERCMEVRKWLTATSITMASPKGLRWQEIQRNAGWQWDPANVGPYKTHQIEGCRI